MQLQIIYAKQSYLPVTGAREVILMTETGDAGQYSETDRFDGYLSETPGHLANEYELTTVGVLPALGDVHRYVVRAD